jgi:hypothetical protein
MTNEELLEKYVQERIEWSVCGQPYNEKLKQAIIDKMNKGDE